MVSAAAPHRVRTRHVPMVLRRASAQAHNSPMTLDQVCQEAQALTPEAARMAEIMLPQAGPMASAWQTEVERSLGAAAQGQLPMSSDQTADLLHAALHPGARARWLVGNANFRLAHRWVVHVHLAAERWNSFAMVLLDDQDGGARH